MKIGSVCVCDICFAIDGERLCECTYNLASYEMKHINRKVKGK